MKDIILMILISSFFLLLNCNKTPRIKAKGKNESIVFTNAVIYTLDLNNPIANALVIKSNKIIYVGDEEKALEFKDTNTTVIDLNGKTVIPGLVDAHAHIAGLGKALMNLNLVGTKSFEEIVGLAKEAAQKSHKDKWIIGRGWDQNDWNIKVFPNHKILSDISPNHPALLTRVDGHAALANEKALEIAGITSTTKNPSGGQIIEDDKGNPTGVLIDNAIDLVTKHIPSPTKDEIKKRILEAQESCFKFGLTQVHDAGISEDEFEAFMELGKEGKLKMCVYAMVYPNTDLYKRLIKDGPIVDMFGGKFTLRAIKMLADGALGSRGALLSKPYSDKPGAKGLLLMPVEYMQKISDEGIKAGFQIAIHAIGDAGNTKVIDIFENSLKKIKVDDPRLRVEHVQIIKSEDIKRMKDLNLIASMQPTHCTSDMPWVPKRLGSERSKWAYSWKSIINTGIHFASGSDFPVESNDPLLGIYAAVTRQKTDGTPEGGYNPFEKLSRLQAIESFTKGAAYASFEENKKGIIKEGMLADFTVLSKDIFKIPDKEILNTEVLMTLIDGEIVYSKKIN